MIEPKFKVGDVLKPVLDDTGLIKCHIVEILTQVCPVGPEGVQVTYSCRVHTKSYKSSPACVHPNTIRFHEFELEPWKHGTQSQ